MTVLSHDPRVIYKPEIILLSPTCHYASSDLKQFATIKNFLLFQSIFLNKCMLMLWWHDLFLFLCIDLKSDIWASNESALNKINGKMESAKLRTLPAKSVLKYQRALRAYVLTCQRAFGAYVLTFQRASFDAIIFSVRCHCCWSSILCW